MCTFIFLQVIYCNHSTSRRSSGIIVKRDVTKHRRNTLESCPSEFMSKHCFVFNKPLHKNYSLSMFFLISKESKTMCCIRLNCENEEDCFALLNQFDINTSTSPNIDGISNILQRVYQGSDPSILHEQCGIFLVNTSYRCDITVVCLTPSPSRQVVLRTNESPEPRGTRLFKICRFIYRTDGQILTQPRSIHMQLTIGIRLMEKYNYHWVCFLISI